MRCLICEWNRIVEPDPSTRQEKNGKQRDSLVPGLKNVIHECVMDSKTCSFTNFAHKIMLNETICEDFIANT